MRAVRRRALGYCWITAALIVVSAGIQGCASPGRSTPAQMGSETTVESVIEDRLLRGLFPHLKAERRRGRGEITFDAAFNDVNYAQLTEPQRVLRDYCAQSGGTFSQLARSRVSAALMAKPALTPAQVFEQHKQAYGVLGMSDRAAGIGAAFDTQFYSAAIKAQYPKAIRDTLAGADQAGVFGLFDCRVDERPVWVALVEPIRFNPMKNPSNLLGSPTMTLYIKGSGLAPS